MARSSFRHRIEIATTPAEVHAFLMDLHNYRTLHPLIESLSELPPSDEWPGARRYEVVDRIALGPFRFRTRYVASLRELSPLRIEGRAWQTPGVRLRTVYESTPSEVGTLLVEEVDLEAPWLLHRFVHAQARDAHLETLRSLRSLLEGGG